MAVATGQDRTIYRSQDVILPFTLAGVDASGWTWRYRLRHGNTAAALLTITGAAIVATYDAPSDTTTIEVTLTSAQTAVTCQAYRQALWRIDAGETYPVSIGQLTIAPSAEDV